MNTQNMSYDARPSLLIVSDRGGERLAGLADAAGARPILPPTPADALALLDSGGFYDAILYHAADEVDEKLVGRLHRAASDSGTRGVVVCGLHQIDTAMTWIDHSDIALACSDDLSGLIVEIALATRPRRAALHDIAKDVNAVRLARLSEEIARIAQTLAEMAESSADASTGGITLLPMPADGLEENAELGTALRNIIRARRLRDQYFPGDLFADPAWDVLLDLMAARCERQPVSVSSLCIAAAVPPTTALRWIRTMTDAGLLVRRADATDGRRVFIELADQTAITLRTYLAQLGDAPVI